VSPAYLDILRSLLPPDWTVTHFDIWLRASSERTPLEPQGFKIHVSVMLANAEAILRSVVPECVRAEVMFKIAAHPTLLRFLSSKRYGRAGSGKFMTIYPPTEAKFLELIEAIHQATRGLEGPYILSDRRYRDSKVVFYRYGGFQNIQSLSLDGTRRSMIRRPDGTLIPDERVPYFKLPDWVADPFPAPGEAEDETEPLNGRYDVAEALTFSSSGGIYRALDRITGRDVVIKEARPRTDAWFGTDFSVDSITALKREGEILRRLQGLPFVPELIELFQEWEHSFLVISYFDGVSLAKLRARDDFILLSYMDEPERILQFCKRLRALALQLLDAVEAVHARGLILGDISPGNVLVNEDSGEIALVDFEGTCSPETDSEVAPYASQWFNAGFRKPERRPLRTLEPFDDFYALGMLLYNLVCPIQTLFELTNADPFRILDHLVEEGLPCEARRIIQALVEGHSNDARKEAETWKLST
jgi:hypothetical protein